MQSKTLRKSYLWFLTGSGLLNAIVFTFIILSLSFISGHHLAAWHFPLGVLIALGLNYYAARHFLPGEFMNAFRISSLIILAILCISILAGALFYDISFDGQMYHLESALQMKAGWNPFKKEIAPDYNQAIWLNHYGKGVEAPQAAIYALTNKIETTKATNFILIAASFCLSLSLLIRLNRFSNRKNGLIAVLFAFNPVSMYLLLCTYVDGQLCSFLLCFIVVGWLLFLDPNRYFLVLFASILIIVINIKFTSIVFAAIFTIGMLFIFLITKQKKTFQRTFIVAAVATIFAVGIVGYFPYIINLTRYHDVFYPGMKMLQSEAAKQTPDRFLSMNRFNKFFISFFAHTDNLHLYLNKNPEIPLKIPFTINKTDILNASKPYVVYMGGFGPFFSGIFLSAIALFALAVYRLKNWKSIFPVILIIGTILTSVFIVSEAWYARYAPQLWFVPLILLLASETDARKNITRFRNAIYLIALLNISFTLASFPYVLYKSAQINYELAQLKALNQIIPVQFTYYTSNRAKLLEYGIPYKEDSIPDNQALYMVGSATKYLPPSPMPDLPKSWILRIGDRIAKRVHP